MLVEDLERLLEELAPREIAEPWDTVGLLVGRRGSSVSRVLVALDLTEEVVVEAATGDAQAIISHHPLLFTPLPRVTDRDRRGIVVTQLIAADIAYFALHTNLDGARDGLCDLVCRELGLLNTSPLVRTSLGQKKLVGFIPAEAVDGVCRAVFAAGAGRIGAYEECAFQGVGQGTFTPGERARPHVGSPGEHERVDEIRWETVVPEGRLRAVIEAYLEAHPYEEPAFDIYPLEDVRSDAGQGRVGATRVTMSLVSLAEAAAELFSLPEVCFAGDPDRPVDRVAVVTGSGASMIGAAAEAADVLVTGDLRYHDAEQAGDLRLSLLSIPHEHLESWALRRWCAHLAERLRGEEVEVRYAERTRPQWRKARPMTAPSGGRRDAWEVTRLFDLEEVGGERPATHQEVESARSGDDEPYEPEVHVLRIDGGSRGNPGPSAIGVVLENSQGIVLEEIGARIGTATNNQAEYQALITGLETALDRGVANVRILSDSELLVRQLRQEYKVRSEGLKELFLQVAALVREFERVEIRHIPREENAAADALVNQALDGKI